MRDEGPTGRERREAQSGADFPRGEARDSAEFPGGGTRGAGDRLSFPRRAALGAIRFYQRALSPHFPASCRYWPSCSEYAAQAVARYGVLKGSWLAFRRILRCHPFHPGGYDPLI